MLAAVLGELFPRLIRGASCDLRGIVPSRQVRCEISHLLKFHVFPTDMRGSKSGIEVLAR